MKRANNYVKSEGRNSMFPDYLWLETREYTYDQDGYPLTRKDTRKMMQGEQVVSTSQDAFWYRYTR